MEKSGDDDDGEDELSLILRLEHDAKINPSLECIIIWREKSENLLVLNGAQALGAMAVFYLVLVCFLLLE